MQPHSLEFRRRRMQNWIFLGLMYGFFYLSRYNLISISADLSLFLGWNNTAYGLITSTGKLIYGLAVFFNGPLADRIGGKRTVLLGAAGAAFFSLLLGCSSYLVVHDGMRQGTLEVPPVFIEGVRISTMIAIFAVLWACNNYFQSFGALSVVKVNASWFHIKERGRFSGIFGIMIQGGRQLAFWLGPFLLAHQLHWRYVFFIPAALLALMWLVAKIGIEDSPGHAGFDDFDTGDGSHHEINEKVTFGFLVKRIFAQPTTWIIAIASLCIGTVRHSMDDWFGKYFAETFNPFITDAKLQKAFLNSFQPYRFVSLCAPLTAIVGGLLAGNISDRVFGSRRAPVICIALLAQVIFLFFLSNHLPSAWTAAILLVTISLFINSSHSILVGTASMDFGGRKAVATAAGFFDGAQYVGGALMGAVCGRLLDHFKDKLHPGVQYKIWPLIPIPFALLGAVLIATLWNAKPKGRGGAH